MQPCHRTCLRSYPDNIVPCSAEGTGELRSGGQATRMRSTTFPSTQWFCSHSESIVRYQYASAALCPARCKGLLDPVSRSKKFQYSHITTQTHCWTETSTSELTTKAESVYVLHRKFPTLLEWSIQSQTDHRHQTHNQLASPRPGQSRKSTQSWNIQTSIL